MEADLPQGLSEYIDVPQALSYVNGRRETLRQLLLSYVEWEEHTPENLLLAALQNRKSEVVKEVHRLKTSVRQIGASKHAEAIDLIEENLKTVPLEVMSERIENFCSSYQELIEGLKRCFARE
jgi:HPt (histidine-containing phosphotransfer) domain-containing protein